MSTYARYSPESGSTGGGGGGTVTSVGLSLPSIFTVTGSPVTTSGTLTGSLNSESANTVFSGPAAGPAATPTFRALVSADIPSLAYANKTLSNLTSPTAINQSLNFTVGTVIADENLNTAFDVINRKMYDRSTNIFLDFSPGTGVIYDSINFNNVSVDVANRKLFSSSGTFSVDYDGGVLVDSLNVLAENWSLRLLYDTSGTQSIDWDQRKLYDTTGTEAANCFNSVQQFTVQKLGVGNSLPATTPGSVNAKIEVFDATGASIGFIAVYDTIT